VNGLGDVAKDGARLFRERPAIVVGAAVLGLLAVRFLGDRGTGEGPADGSEVVVDPIERGGTFGQGYAPGTGALGMYADGGSLPFTYGDGLGGPPWSPPWPAILPPGPSPDPGPPMPTPDPMPVPTPAPPPPAPAPAPAPAPSPAPGPAPIPAPNRTARCNSVRLRTAPSLTAAIRATVNIGARAHSTGRIAGASYSSPCGGPGSLWYRIDVLNGSRLATPLYSAANLWR